MPPGAGLSGGLDQRRRLVRAPGEALNLFQKSRQERRADPCPHARQDDGGPEAQGARVRERPRNLRVRADAFPGCVREPRPRSQRLLPQQSDLLAQGAMLAQVPASEALSKSRGLVRGIQGNRAKRSPPPLWGRIKEGGRARPRKLFIDALRGERSATPHPCPPPQGGRERAEPSEPSLRPIALLGDLPKLAPSAPFL